MLKFIFSLLLITCLTTGIVSAATDPFVGKWKVTPGKSKLTDEMKVEAAGANRYQVTFAPGQVETIVADGSDQPALAGTTFSITVKGLNSWTVARKQGARTLLSADWTLSADGKTLTDVFTGYQPDGSTLVQRLAYQRTTGTSGFLGTWHTESEEFESVLELQIQPYQGDGLSINDPEAQITTNMKFDGNDYPNLGPNAPPGYMSSGRRVNERRLEIAHTYKGKIIDTQQIELSPDLKTLTLSRLSAGESKPKEILVFSRE
jgi:hypothetical protein